MPFASARRITICVFSVQGTIGKRRGIVFPITRGNGNKYLDYLTLRRDILPAIVKAEDKEIAEGEKLNKSFITEGFNIEKVRKFNAKADKRFEAFREKMQKILEK